MNILKNMLRLKKVLFILDDVSHREQFEFLVGGTERFGMGSGIILTARDKHLLISHVGENVYEVQLLSEDEALELFSRHAFREKSPKEDFMELSRQVVKHAGGLPLALKVLCASFYGRDKKHWKHMIARLKRIPHNDIVGRLRLSFDCLDKDEKELFLDIVFLNVACLTKYNFHFCVELLLGDASHGFLIDYLMEKSLLSINIDNRIVMHNMIREMGGNVIREEYANSRIWLPEEVCDLFKGKLITEKVESLCIPEGYCFEDDLVNYSNIFKRLQSLKILIVRDRTFSSKCAIAYLPSSLRFIDWWEYPSVSLPESFEPSQLLVLCLRESRLVELWPISKTLSLLGSTSLQEFPEICGDMHHLSTLIVGSPWIGSLPPSLSGLRILLLTDCEVIESIPDTFRNLRVLRISGCNKLATLPNSLFESQQLEYVKIYECSGLVKLPKSLGVQKHISSLEINRCEKLKKLQSSIQMESLKELKISYSPKLDTFPEIKGDMHCLKELTLNSTGIREVPASIWHLRGLKAVYLKGCEDLVSLPDSLCSLMNLQYLYLSGCKKLEKLPENIGDLQELYILDASKTAISEPPLSITKLGKLWNLSFSNDEQQFQHSSSFVLHQLSVLSSLQELD